MRSHAEATHILRNQYYVPIVPLRKWRPSTVQDSPLVAQIELSCKSSSYSLAICHAPELQMNFKAAHGMHGGGGPWRQWTHTSQGSAKDENHYPAESDARTGQTAEHIREVCQEIHSAPIALPSQSASGQVIRLPGVSGSLRAGTHIYRSHLRFQIPTHDAWDRSILVN